MRARYGSRDRTVSAARAAARKTSTRSKRRMANVEYTRAGHQALRITPGGRVENEERRSASVSASITRKDRRDRLRLLFLFLPGGAGGLLRLRLVDALLELLETRTE